MLLLEDWAEVLEDWAGAGQAERPARSDKSTAEAI
jgi:hypothetical protein